MDAPVAAAEIEQEERPHRQGVNPIVIVGATLLAVVVATFLIYSIGDYDGQDGFVARAGGGAGQSSAGACGQGTPTDGSYTVDYVANPDPPRPEGTTFQLTVRNGGRAVTGAKVCMAADMPDMQHPGLSSVAREGSGGRYEARIQFGMGGSWKTSVIIAEPDKPVVSVPLTIQVAEIQAN